MTLRAPAAVPANRVVVRAEINNDAGDEFACAALPGLIRADVISRMTLPVVVESRIPIP